MPPSDPFADLPLEAEASDPFANLPMETAADDPFADLPLELDTSPQVAADTPSPAAVGEPLAEATADVDTTGRAATAAGQFARGAAAMASGTVKGLGISGAEDAAKTLRLLDAADAGDDPTLAAPRGLQEFVREYMNGDAEERAKIRSQLASHTPESDPLIAAGNLLDKFVEEHTPTNPKYEQELLAGKLPRAFGSMTGFMIGGLLSKGIGVSGAVAPAAMGSLVQKTELFEDALRKGASIADAYSAANLGSVIGLSEAAPIAAILSRLDKGSGGLIKRSLVNALVGGTEEAIQELGQTVFSNLVASDLVKYDPDRKMWVGAGEGAGIGFTTGGVMAMLATFIGGRRGGRAPPAPVVEDPAAIQTAVDVLDPRYDPNAITPTPHFNLGADAEVTVAYPGLNEGDLNSPLRNSDLDAGHRIIADALGAPIDQQDDAEETSLSDLLAERVPHPETTPVVEPVADLLADRAAAVAERPIAEFVEPQVVEAQPLVEEVAEAPVEQAQEAVEAVEAVEAPTPAPIQEIAPDGAPVSPQGRKQTSTPLRKLFTKKKVGGALARADWAIVTAEKNGVSKGGNQIRNNRLVKKMRAEGIEFIPVEAKSGGLAGRSFIIQAPKAKAEEIREEFNQESVLTKDGLLYKDKVEAASGVTVHDKEPNDFYTKIPGTDTFFTVDLREGQIEEAVDSAEEMPKMSLRRPGGASKPVSTAEIDKSEQDTVLSSIRDWYKATFFAGQAPKASVLRERIREFSPTLRQLHTEAARLKNEISASLVTPQSVVPAALEVRRKDTKRAIDVLERELMRAARGVTERPVEAKLGASSEKQLRALIKKQYPNHPVNNSDKAKAKSEPKPKTGEEPSFARRREEAIKPAAADNISLQQEEAPPEGSTFEGVSTEHSDMFVEQRAAVTKELRRLLNNMALTQHVNLDIADTIEARYSGGVTVTADGYYFKGMINAALDATNIRHTLHHESIHAMRDIDLFKPAEWRALEKAAVSEWIEKHKIKERYPDLSADRQMEEAIAEEFGDYMEAPPSARQNGFIGKAFARIKALLEATGRALRGKGFHTAESVFKGAASGRIGRRGAQRAGLSRSTKFSTQSSPAPVFFSALTQAVEGMKQSKASAQQWLATIKKTAGVKTEEIAWSGIEDWLTQQQGAVTKEALLANLRQNEVKIEEVTKGVSSGSVADVIAFHDLSDGAWNGATQGEQDELIREFRAVNKEEEAGAKFETWQLAGAAEGSYRELLLTLPVPYSLYDKRFREIAAAHGRADSLSGFANYATPEETAELQRLAANAEGQQLFTGGHFDEPNVLAHIRFNERTDAEGGRVLFIEEIQSDWHQKGRKQGYSSGGERKDLPQNTKFYEPNSADNPGGANIWTVELPQAVMGRNLFYGQSREEAASNAELFIARPTRNPVPDAPFKSTWHELAFKRMLRYAAENGFDSISWTTGAQQVDRYESALRNAVDEIHWEKTPEGVHLKGYKGATSLNWERDNPPPTELTELPDSYTTIHDMHPNFPGREWSVIPADQGHARPLSSTHVSEKEAIADAISYINAQNRAGWEQLRSNAKANNAPVVDTTEKESALSDAIGKSMGDKILADPAQSGVIKGDGITVSSTGMAGFYDQMLPRYANKYGKKWGAQAGRTDIGIGDFQVVDDSGVIATGATREDAERTAGRMRGIRGSPVRVVEKSGDAHSFPVTDAMKESVLKGQPMFARRRPVALTGNTFNAPSQEAWEFFHKRNRHLFNLSNVTDAVRQKLQDRFLVVQRSQEAIEIARGGALPQSSDVYRAEELYYGRAGKRLDDFKDHVVRPLIQAINDAGLSTDELQDFLYARHAKERNAQIAKINKEFPDGGSGMTNAEAKTILDAARASGKIEAYESLSRMVDSITRSTMRVRVAGGLMDQATADLWNATYKHYMPLKGFDEGGEEQGGGPKIGKGFDIRGAEEKRATGRESRAADILANVITAHEEAIVRAEKNKVSQTFLRLVVENPNKNVWEVEAVSYKPLVNKTTGMVTYQLDPKRKLADNVLAVKVEGKVYHITIYHDGLARAMKNIGAETANGLIRTMQRTNRWLAFVNTSSNPEFVLSNFARDLTTAGINIQGFDEKKLTKVIMKDTVWGLRAIRGSFRGIRGDEASEWGKHYQEFAKEGGKTAFFALDDIEAQKRKIKKLLNEIDPSNWQQVVKSTRAVEQLIQDVNAAVENGVRLATYVNLRRRDVSKSDAASAAKNLTVNFNRRGEWAGTAAALYLFYNATFQGNVRVLKALKSRRVQKVAAGVVLTFALLEVLNGLASPEDDDEVKKYDKITKYTKYHNLIVVNPWSEGDDFWNPPEFKVPLPYGYNVFAVIGYEMGGVIRSAMGTGPKKTAIESAADIAVEALNTFNPTGGGSSLLDTLVPTATKPFYEIEVNKNFMDNPIRPERFKGQENVPDSELYFRNASGLSKMITSELNRLTGGNPARAGGISVSPETFDHFAKFITGGTGAFLGRTTDLVYKIASGEGSKVRWTDIPLARRLIEGNSDYYTKSRYFEIVRAANGATDEVEHFRSAKDFKSAKSTKEKYAPELYAVNILKPVEKLLRGLRKQRKDVEVNENIPTESKDQRLERFDARMDRIMKSVIRRYNGRVRRFNLAK